jgi:ubiquinone/menaquinone biosynthesis C-methylase UbiE
MSAPEAVDPRSLSRDRFGRFADAYVNSPSHAAGPDLALLLDMARPRPGWIALDVGTGGGHTALLLAPHVARVVATDLSPAMLAAARTHLAKKDVSNVEFVPADAEDLPFASATFDLVTCRNAAHHLPDPPAFAAEAVRVLRPGGRLVVQDQCAPEDAAAAAFVNDFERQRDPSHVRALTETEWHRLFRTAGLDVERVQQIEKRHDLEDWTRVQECDTDTVAGLLRSLQEAPPIAAEWMLPRFENGAWSFGIRQILISGRVSH